ncbi:MAG: sugar ABC transporter permease [Oscillospiraceae bacterium]
MFTPVMWQYVGFYFVIIVTGLNNISPELYEAASIDGANGFKRVRYVTLPLLHNTLCTCLTLAITGALKVFDLPWVMMGQGMPLDKSWLLGTYMYHQTFNVGDVDYGSTLAIFIVVLGVAISQIANAVFKEKDY